MKIRTKSQWPVLFCMGCVGSETEATIPSSQFYSGAEWVLDSNGEVVASTAVLFERRLDTLHGTFRVDTIRETPDARSGLSAESHDSLALVAVQATPWKLDARMDRDDGIKSVFEEESAGNVLVSRDIQIDASGHVLTTRVTNATALSEVEFRSWSKRMMAHH